MTGFDPTAPARDTDQDAPDEFPDNVVPPEALTGDASTGSSETADPEPETHGEH